MMATRFTKPVSLIDLINVNELLSIQEISNGLRYRFREKILPEWFKDLAKSLHFTMQDNDPGGLHGRIVSLVDDRHISPVSYRSKKWQ